MKNAEEQLVSNETIQKAYIHCLNVWFERQVPGGDEWKDRLPVPKTLKLRLPAPVCRAERQVLDLWVSIITERSDVQFDIDLVHP